MRISRRIKGLRQRLGGFRGHVDGIIGDALVGWVQPLRPGEDTARVGLFVRGARIAETSANVYRGDLEAAGVGAGTHGFAITLTSDLVRLAMINGGEIEVRALLGSRNHFLGACRLDDAAGDGKNGGTSVPAWLSPLQKRLYGDAQLLSNLLSRPAPARRDPPVSSAGQARLFDCRDYLNANAELPPEMFGYTEYIRYRDRLDEKFDTAHEPEDVAHFYKRYLGAYGAMRAGLRIPLSKTVIDYLNEPVVIGGQRNSLTRAAWAFLMDVPQILHTMNFDAHDWYVWAVYWWSVNQSEAIHCEDCLVPQNFIDVLSAVPESWEGKTFAPSEFMLRQHSEIPEFGGLDLQTEEGRSQLTCALLLASLSRPDYLRYIPEATREAALDESEGVSALQQFVEAMGHSAGRRLNTETYAGALRWQSFDLDSLRFLTFTAEGHRAEYAQLPPPETDAVKSEVQVIGPFRKASGLGQATRLSTGMLTASGFDVNTVDFGLDNPAPEGFSRAEAVSDYRPAKINIIHLNAEAIPLVHAYQPDYFSDAYNIGYFFWELDSPGACHYLGMDLLDEIWVSTEYGVSVFQPHTNVPVVNVGMSFEVLPEIEPKKARAFLEKQTGVAKDDFVFLVTFDSFSFVQRKNPLGVLKAFAKAFEGEDGVKLVIKTQNRTRVADPAQIAIWKEVDEVLKTDPRIILLNETVQYTDLLRLKKGADGYISLHRAEGWGFGMIEAMNLGVPVLATAYSGNMDFCDPETCWLVDYTLKELGPQDYIFVRPGQKWAEPDIAHAALQMRAMVDDPEECARRAEAARRKVQTEFSEAAIGKRYAARLREILDELSKGKPKNRDGSDAVRGRTKGAA